MECGDVGKAQEKYLEALSGERQPMLLANVANCYVKLKQPANAFVFLDAALEMNPDSAKAHKIYAAAAKSLGQWDTALKHAQLALKIDFDDATFDLEKAINLKYAPITSLQSQLAQAEKDLEFAEKLSKQAELQQRVKEEQAREAAEKAAEGMGMGGMPPGFNDDPDIQAVMSNPRLMAALQEIMSNPAAMAKYADDKEVQEAMSKLQAKFGGMGGGMGGMPGAGMGAGMPGGGMSAGMPGGVPGGMPGAGDDGPSVEVVDDVD